MPMDKAAYIAATRNLIDEILFNEAMVWAEKRQKRYDLRPYNVLTRIGSAVLCSDFYHDLFDPDPTSDIEVKDLAYPLYKALNWATKHQSSTHVVELYQRVLCLHFELSYPTFKVGDKIWPHDLDSDRLQDLDLYGLDWPVVKSVKDIPLDRLETEGCQQWVYFERCQYDASGEQRQILSLDGKWIPYCRGIRNSELMPFRCKDFFYDCRKPY